MGTYGVSFTLLHCTPLIRSCVSDTTQCTSQMNPGKIEIHLQTFDHNQWRRNHSRAGLTRHQKHMAAAQWGGRLWKGESAGDYISGPAGGSVGGAGGAQERTHGGEFGELTQTDRGQYVVEVRRVVLVICRECGCLTDACGA